MITLTERTIMKSRSGVYSDTSENRRKHRVGQKYGADKQPEDDEKNEKKEADPEKELEAVNKVIAAINEGKLNLPAAEVMKLSEKKQKLEDEKKQAEKINAGVKANEEKINEAQKKEKGSEKAPEGVSQQSYDSITKKARATQLGYTLNIDGKDVRVERTIDTSGGKRTPVYQIHGMEKKYWDLDKMISDYRKNNDAGKGKSDIDKEEVKETNKKIENRGELTNEEKANVTPFGNPELYIQLSKNSEEKKKLIELLKEVGTVEKEETVQTGISGTYKVGNEYFQISGTNVTTGLKKKKGDSQYLGMSGHKRWYGGGKFFEKTDKSEEFSVFDDEKMSALTKKLTKKSSKEPEKKEKPKNEDKSKPQKERVSLSGWEGNSFSDAKKYGEDGVVESMAVQAVPNLKDKKYEYSASVSASKVSFEATEAFHKEAENLKNKLFSSPNEAAKAADEFANKWNSKDSKSESKQGETEAHKKEADPEKERVAEIERVRNRIESLENMRRNLTPSVGKEKRNEIRNEIIDEKNRLKELLSRTRNKESKSDNSKLTFEQLRKEINELGHILSGRIKDGRRTEDVEKRISDMLKYVSDKELERTLESLKNSINPTPTTKIAAKLTEMEINRRKTEGSTKQTEKKEETTKEEPKSEPKQSEAKESYSRIKFDDLPNSGKVNLKKYLSDKVRNQADENLGVLSKVSFENLQTMEKGLVKEFNSQFGSLSKSRRAEKLYSIMKVKSELENRKQEESKKYQKYTSSLDDNTLLSIGYDLGEEIRKLSSRGFSTLEQQQEVLKKISELSGKRQINEDEQRKRMDKLNNSPDETRANKKGELAKRGSGSKNEEAELSENIELNPAKASEFVEGIKKLYPGYVSSVKSDIPGNWDFSVKNKAATSSGNNYMGVFSVDYKNKKILYESSQFGDDKYTETYDVAQDLSKKLNFKLTDERGRELKLSY